MNDELNQKISQFLDDELDNNEALILLKQIRSQPELSNTLNRYEAISHALKADVFLTVKSDFSSQISQKIAHEPVYLLPQRKLTKHRYKIAALAASVALVAVFVERSMNTGPAERFNQPSSMQLAQQQLPSSPAPKSLAPIRQPEQTPLNDRISDYLQAHNSRIHSHSEADLKNLTSVTAYRQE
ncbi:MAG: sigma-E factor negative regulatory protein [Methylovulum sp.]